MANLGGVAGVQIYVLSTINPFRRNVKRDRDHTRPFEAEAVVVRSWFRSGCAKVSALVITHEVGLRVGGVDAGLGVSVGVGVTASVSDRAQRNPNSSSFSSGLDASR